MRRARDELDSAGCRAVTVSPSFAPAPAWGRVRHTSQPAMVPCTRGSVGGQEADARDQQQAGVKRGRPVGLGEGVALGVERVRDHVVMDLVAEPLPPHHRAGQAVAAYRSRHPVGRHPGHDLGVGEVLPVAAHLPQAVVRFSPGRFEVIHQGDLQGPGVTVGGPTGLPGQEQGVQRLTPDVELELTGRGVAGADRAAAFVTGEPGQVDLGESARTVNAVEKSAASPADLLWSAAASHATRRPHAGSRPPAGPAGHR